MFLPVDRRVLHFIFLQTWRKRQLQRRAWCDWCLICWLDWSCVSKTFFEPNNPKKSERGEGVNCCLALYKFISEHGCWSAALAQGWDSIYSRTQYKFWNVLGVFFLFTFYPLMKNTTKFFTLYTQMQYYFCFNVQMKQNLENDNSDAGSIKMIARFIQLVLPNIRNFCWFYQSVLCHFDPLSSISTSPFVSFRQLALLVNFCIWQISFTKHK